jgi:hypothetical protein
METEVTSKKSTVESVAEAKADNKKFITRMFVIANIIAISLAIFYWCVSISDEKMFHCIILFGAGGITIPMFLCTMRLMLKGYYLSLEGWQSTSRMMEGYDQLQKKAEPIAGKIEMVVDKAGPIAENVEEIVARAKGMSGDIEQVAHKIKDVTESMNGSFNGQVLEEVRDSLKRIADVFSGKVVSDKEGAPVTPGELPIPAFDPTKMRRRK